MSVAGLIIDPDRNLRIDWIYVPILTILSLAHNLVQLMKCHVSGKINNKFAFGLFSAHVLQRCSTIKRQRRWNEGLAPVFDSDEREEGHVFFTIG